MRTPRGGGARLRTALFGVLLAAGAAGAEPARIDYMLQCQGCHRADGTGSPGSVPSLVGTVGLFLAVPGGREYLIRVPGSAQSPLDDTRLAAVLNFMVREFGPADAAATFEPFTPGEVARHRAPPLVDVDGVRVRLLRAVREAQGGSAERSISAPPRRRGGDGASADAISAGHGPPLR